MAEVFFYHLTTSPLEQALPDLLEKVRGNNWRALSDPPVDLLAYHIGHDLAYSTTQSLSVEKCQSIAKAFVALPDFDSKWFTNNLKKRFTLTAHLDMHVVPFPIGPSMPHLLLSAMRIHS